VDAYCLPKAKKQRKKRGGGMKEDHQRYNYGASNKAILFEAMYDRDSPIHDKKSRLGKQFRTDYGVSWVVFSNVCNDIEQRLNPCSWMRKLKDVPFKLRIMACLRQIRLGGPLGQHYSNYSMDYNSFKNIFLYCCLEWVYAMKDDYIKLTRTKDEINHVKRLYRAAGHPCCIGSIDCVHVIWNTCEQNLNVQCTNAGAGDTKGNPSVVFEVTSSYTTKIMHVSRMFWGATIDSIIVKFNEAVWELMNGIYATHQFKMFKDHDTTIIDFGLYIICDGGYPNMKCLIPPFKWCEVGSKIIVWSFQVESSHKYVDHTFGSLKKRRCCLIKPIDLLDPCHIEPIFITFCILHNMLVDHDGMDD
jgi:hypothetical protein